MIDEGAIPLEISVLLGRGAVEDVFGSGVIFWC
jgi:hypothetical protein